MPAPIYTAANCPNPAYQLNWTYSLFWHEAHGNTLWLEPLRHATESDCIRILQHQFSSPTVSQFLISSLPSVSPQTIAQRLKGRLQYVLRPQVKMPFQRNYALRSIGSGDREAIENYVSHQLENHPCADVRVTS